MASLSLDRKTGRRTIQFIGMDGKRRSIRLGKVSKPHAVKVKTHVEELAAAARTGHCFSDETARWLKLIGQQLADRLAEVGLIATREVATLDAFIGGYVGKRPNVKGSTKLVWGHTRRCLVEFFGADKRLRDVTPGEADDWREWLIENEKLSAATVERRCGIAKQFFKSAVRRRLLTENPFADLKSGCQVNDARAHFISRETAAKILEACPDVQWRLLFALSRFGGLRCPSEHLALRWGDIDWERQRITVHSPKTEHHRGKGQRIIPLFNELRPYLDGAFEAAEPGTEFVITRYRDDTANLRTQLLRIIERAGVKPWPKLFQNLRASCATELAKTHPAHVAAAWLGHTPRVAQRHYWQTTDADFDTALETQPESGAKSGAGEAETPVQNPVQQPTAIDGSGRAKTKTARQTPAIRPPLADGCRFLPEVGMGDTRLELVTPSLSS